MLDADASKGTEDNRPCQRHRRGKTGRRKHHGKKICVYIVQPYKGQGGGLEDTVGGTADTRVIIHTVVRKNMAHIAR